jgi:hypothetical protein
VLYANRTSRFRSPHCGKHSARTEISSVRNSGAATVSLAYCARMPPYTPAEAPGEQSRVLSSFVSAELPTIAPVRFQFELITQTNTNRDAVTAKAVRSHGLTVRYSHHSPGRRSSHGSQTLPNSHTYKANGHSLVSVVGQRDRRNSSELQRLSPCSPRLTPWPIRQAAHSKWLSCSKLLPLQWGSTGRETSMTYASEASATPYPNWTKRGRLRRIKPHVPRRDTGPVRQLMRSAW